MTLKNLMGFAFGPVLAALLSFITLPYIAWVFSIEDVGRFSLFQIIMGLGVMIFSLSLHQSYVREYNEVSSKPQLLLLALAPGFTLFLLLTCAAILFSLSPSKLVFGLVDRSIDSLIFIAAALALIINSLSHSLRMKERSIAFSISQIIPRLSLLALILVLVFATDDRTFITILWAHLISSCITTVYLVYLVKDEIKGIQSLSIIDWPLLYKMLKFSLPLIIGGIAYWLLQTIDRVLLKAYSGIESLGIYSIAVSIASGATILTTVFCTIWHPLVYKKILEDVDIEFFQSVTDNIFIAVVAIWTVVGIFSGVTELVLPPQYASTKYLVVACVGAPLFYLLSETTVIGVGISRKSFPLMIGTVVACLIAVVLSHFLIQAFSEKGAAIASLLSFACFFIIRTEVSTYLWKSLRRRKMYLILLLCTSWTIIFTLELVSSLYNALAWLVIFCTTLYFFSNRIAQAINYLKSQLLKV